MPPNDRVMLITGTSKGIGRFLAEHYASVGYNVVGCARSESDLNTPSYRHYIADVSDEPAVKRIFAGIRSEFGRLDVLVNNAGIASMNHALLTPASTWRRIFDTNALGTFLFCREAGKMMQRARYGRIVNFTSVATPLKLAGEAAYAASKAAIESMTRVLSEEFGEFGVTVNAVGPPPIDTALIRSVPQEKLDAIVARQAIKRFGTFEDVRNVIDFFIAPESDFVTGQTLYLGGV